MIPGERRMRRPNRKATLIVASVAGAVIAGAGIASGSGGGGVGTPSPPTAKDVRCLERCLDVRTVTETGIAEISGRDLGSVVEVRLPGPEGKLKIEPRKVKNGYVQFKVPKGAATGKPVVRDAYGSKARSPQRVEVKPADRLEEVGDFAVRRAEATPAKSFYDGKKRSRVDYLFEADAPTDIRIDILKGKQRKLVDSIVERDREPFELNTATWDGLRESGKVAPNGKYKYEVSPLSGGDQERAKFRYYDHRFPLQGKHSYGDGLGAGRGHQGQDVFAKCGSKVYAARGGRVQVKASHSAAGYYLVIDGRKTGVDYVYMHLEKRGRPKEGTKVRTGEVIGYESDTGRASGCHLHFEMWSAPGWYEGGRVLNPTKHLKRWDKWS